MLHCAEPGDEDVINTRGRRLPSDGGATNPEPTPGEKLPTRRAPSARKGWRRRSSFAFQAADDSGSIGCQRIIQKT